MRELRIPVVAMASFLLIASCICAQSQERYLLRSDGSVRVNGITVPTTSVVLPGDIVETSKGSTAKIAAPGKSMIVAENSRVSVSNGRLTPSSSSTPAADNTSVSFPQLSGSATSNVCRTAKLCYCKTAKACPNY